MKTSLAVLSLLALAALGAAAKPSARIVGGHLTSLGDYPEMVSVYTDPLIGQTRHLCGGIILNDNHVLTTATCVKDHGSLYVMAAGTNLTLQSGNEEIKAVREVINHEEYDPVNKANDLAILKTTHNFVFVSELVSPAVLPAAGTAEPATGTPMTVVGWGSVDPDGELEESQRAVELTYLTRAECKEVYGSFVQPNEGCVKGDASEGVCVGDEGGLVQDESGTAMAIVSWHINCDSFPAVVTLLAPYHDWIVSHFDS